MRGRKRILAMVLAAAISMTAAAPAMAAEPVKTEARAAAALKNGWNTISGKKYYVKNGKKVTGINTISKKKYYFDSKGVLVVSKYGYKIGSKYYAVSAKGVLTALSAVEGMAGAQLDKLKGQSYEAFKWAASGIRFTNSVKAPASGVKPADYYGKMAFSQKIGDCNTQAYAFYWMAKRRGYDVKYVKGYVPQAQDKNGKPTKFGTHAWVEMKVGTNTYVCDPNLALSEYIRKGKDPKPAYKFRYGAKGTYKYYDTKKKLITKK